MIERFRTFADSTNFTNAIKVTVASVIPVAIASAFGHFEIGFTIALGAFLTYPSDIPSNLEHKLKGLLAAAFIVAGCNVVISLLSPVPSILYPFALLLVFFLSMISVYGQRANMVSFSGLLSIAIAFGNVRPGLEMVSYSGLMLAGGLFYLLVSLIFYAVRPYRYVELELVECMRLTGKYLKYRGDLWDIDAKRSRIIEKQLHLQVELNTHHENIREVLMRNRSESGNSGQNRRLLLVFISLVDIMELGITTSFDHSKLHDKFSGHPKVLETYQNLAYTLAATLKQLSRSIRQSKKYVSRHSLVGDLEHFGKTITSYQSETGDVDGEWMLMNMFHYAEKQVEKINIVERIFTDDAVASDLNDRGRNLEKFLLPQYYPFQTLLDNLSFSSANFRHSLRLTLTILLGFGFGWLLPLQKSYWILLTIIVILRPGYGLTKERSFHRIIGTIAGGAAAFSILYVIDNRALIGTLAVGCMLLGYTYTSINYKVGATFVTMYVVFIYGLLSPDIGQVVQYRIIDTLIGAGLAFAANYFFWPTWEFLNAPQHLSKTIAANRHYLAEIALLYNKKNEIPTSYRVARKNAFIETGNLMASYQRMLQEPRSKQRQLPQLYKLAVLNHTLMSSMASLGTYIQSGRTGSASEAFNAVVRTITSNLSYAEAVLESESNVAEDRKKIDLSVRFTELKNIRTAELRNKRFDDAALQSVMREMHLVIEQLVWMVSLSENIVKESARLKAAA